MDLITKNDEVCLSFLKDIEEMEEAVTGILRNYHLPLNGERYMTDREVSEALRMSRRTLQEYRTEGKISYCMVGGKVLYTQSGIEKMIAENYHSRREDF